MENTQGLHACLNIHIPHIDSQKLDTTFPFTFNEEYERYTPNRDHIRTILNNALTLYEHIYTAQPLTLLDETPNVYIGTINSGNDKQLSLTHALGPNIFFWLNSAIHMYGLNAIIGGEIHGVQRTLHTPPMILASEILLRRLTLSYEEE